MASNNLSVYDAVSPIRSAIVLYYFRYDFCPVENLFANEIPTVNHGFLQYSESSQLKTANNAPISDIRLTALRENRADARGGCWEKFYDVTERKKAFIMLAVLETILVILVTVALELS